MAKQEKTIESFLSEMISFALVNPEKMELAKQSKINTANNKELKDLMVAWTKGHYDEDPELLVQEIEQLLPES